MKISIGIKALNEEATIGAAIESAIEALDALDGDGEIIVADSGSTDRTLEIAKTYSVKIVSLMRASDRSCGAGAQLAFQHSSGDYFYLMDGDMRLNKDFVREAVAFLDRSHDVGGVGGRVVETVIANHEFAIRQSTAGGEAHRKPGAVDRLDGGGLYRRTSILGVKFFADKNLHSYEEFELGARLRQANWQLIRLPSIAVEHFGYKKTSYDLLWVRFSSGYAFGGGEVLRAALGKAHFVRVVTTFEKLRQWILVMIWWVALIVAAGFKSSILLLMLMLLPIVYLSIRRKSVAVGLYSIASWNLFTLGFLLGLFCRRKSACDPIDSVRVQ